MTLPRSSRTAWVLLLLSVAPTTVAGQGTVAAAECPAGVISSVEVRNGSVFDPSATESRIARWAFRTINLLHIRTRAAFIRKQILFGPGDCLDPVLLEESRRMLEGSPNMRDVEVHTEDDGQGGVRAVVTTWDTWSTQFDVGVTYDSGFNLEKLQGTERNLLGLGIFTEATYRHRREELSRSLGFSTPRLFGRLGGGFTLARSRGGDYSYEKIAYPFVGPRGRFSFWENYERGDGIFAWATGGQAEYSHVFVPAFKERVDISAATQFGEPGALLILGFGITRDRFWFGDSAELTYGGDFDDRGQTTVPTNLFSQLEPFSATQIALHLGSRRDREYRRFVGLDAVRETQVVTLGSFASLTVGQSIPVFTPSGSPRNEGQFGRVHLAVTRAAAGGVFYATTTAEARYEGDVRDILAEADIALLARARRLPGHTFFLRAAGAGGWDVARPFQLTLGGREGVRSLVDDTYPGGRMLRFTGEDRIAPDWMPVDWADIGFTIMADVGRMWPGDVPFGTDSGWQAGIGAGLRLALPSGSRGVTRLDFMKPLDGGGVIFRVTGELNALRSLFRTPKLQRSFRVTRAAESF